MSDKFPAWAIKELAIDKPTPQIWDALRLFLAAGKAGSFAKAENIVGVNQTTVSRKISQLEDQLGVELIRRGPEGITLTETGRNVLRQIEQMEQNVRAIENIVNSGFQTGPQNIRIALTDGMANFILAPGLAALREQAPNLTITFLTTHTQVSLTRNQADIAIGFQPYESFDVLNSKLGTLHMHPYASKEYLKKYGRPTVIDDIRHHTIVEHMAYGIDEGNWEVWQKFKPETLTQYKADQSVVHYEMVKSGVGIGMLPNYASTNPELERLELGFDLSMNTYLSYPRSIKDREAIRQVLRWIRQVFQEDCGHWTQSESPASQAPQAAGPARSPS